MEIGRVFSRALEIAWRFKFLWLLGFVMALTGGGGGGSGANSYSGTSPSRPFTGPSPFNFPRLEAAVIAAIVISALCFFLIWLVLVFYLRFVARGAMVSTVRAAENNMSPSLRSAWSEGQGYYGRLLGLGFLVNVPLLILIILVLAAALLPFFGTLILFIREAQSGSLTGPAIAPAVSGLVGVILLICCAALCIGLVTLVVHPIYEFAVRAIVLENTGTMEGLSRGYNRLRTNLGNTLMLYIVLIAARIGWGILTAILAVPAFIALFAVVVGVFSSNPSAAIVLAIVIGVPLGLFFVFLEGLFQVFESNVWTLGYMSLLGLPQTSAVPIVPAPPSAAVAVQ